MRVNIQLEQTTAGRCTTREGCPIAAACGNHGPAPCEDVWSAHDEKLRLCEALEELADSLPAVDRLRCLQIAGILVPLLRVSHRYEEEVVFPAFRKSCPDAAASASSIRRLTTEHVEDECAAQDITEVLMTIGRGGPVDNPEALGFMLRAFFETLRRHIAFEREHVLPSLYRPPSAAE